MKTPSPSPATNPNRKSQQNLDTRRAHEASGHDDQGGSRQSARRDYERVEPGSSQARGGPSDLRYGEQNEQQRRETDRQLREGNVGGQDRNDQARDAFHPPATKE